MISIDILYTTLIVAGIAFTLIAATKVVGHCILLLERISRPKLIHNDRYQGRM